jgi:hypothetical protein
MATFSKRVYKSWRVSAPDCADLSKAFDAQSDAAAYAGELKNAGHENIQIKPYQSLGSQQTRTSTHEDFQDQGDGRGVGQMSGKVSAIATAAK